MEMQLKEDYEIKPTLRKKGIKVCKLCQKVIKKENLDRYHIPFCERCRLIIMNEFYP